MERETLNEEIKRIKSIMGLIMEDDPKFEKKDDKEALKYCNGRLMLASNKILNFQPKKRPKITNKSIFTDDFLSKELETLNNCVDNFEQTLKIPNFAGLNRDEFLNMLKVMYDKNQPDEKRLGYLNYSIKDVALGKEKDKEDVVDPFDIKSKKLKKMAKAENKKEIKISSVKDPNKIWGRINKVGNTTDKFIIKTKDTLVNKNNKMFWDEYKEDITDSIKKIIKDNNLSASISSNPTIEVLNVRGDGPQTIKIKVT